MTAQTVSTLSQQLTHAAQLHQASKLTEAESVYRHLLGKNHEPETTTNLLAIILLQTKRYHEAIGLFEKAIQAGNTQPDTFYNLGVCLAETGQHARAMEKYKECISRNAQHPAAWFNLGIACEQLDLPDDAISAMKTDYSITQRVESLVELSTIYLRKFDWETTEKYAIEALQKDSRNETAMHNLSNARLGRLAGMEVPDLSIVEQSLRLGKSMIAANARSARGYAICGDALQIVGELDLALDHYEKCLELDPENAHVHANVGVIKLMQGDLQRGWQEIIWRENYGKALYGMDVGSYSQCAAPEWDGKIIAGKHLLVASEQGIGDQILQAQLICELLEAGMRVTMTCNEKLITLMQRSLPQATIVSNKKVLPDALNSSIDVKIKQLELCRLLRPTMESFNQRHAYLKPDSALTQHFHDKYKAHGAGLRVGISWKSTSATSGKQKSTRLTQWGSILQLAQTQCPDMRFYSIQYGEVRDDVNEAVAALGVSVYVDDEFNPLNDIEKAAAQIAAMDLVISVSNASVHLAGAMGKPTWVILHYMPLWHWFNSGKTSVWYDSVVLYRQQQIEGWNHILDNIAADLQKFSTQNTATTPVPVTTTSTTTGTDNKVISEEYRRQQQKLHENPNYGTMSIQFAPIIKQFAEQLKVKSISDYGAGKQNLIKTLNNQHNFNLPYYPYDPAFPEYGPPKKAELVCCIDVLEHIEPELLKNVINDLKEITTHYGFFSIHTGPAVKVLSDGRNAHLIQQPSSWWLPKLCEHFEIELLNKTPGGFFVLVSPRLTR